MNEKDWSGGISPASDLRLKAASPFACSSRRALTLSRSALSLVAALPWRGNAAELRKLLESVVAGMEGRPGIAVEDLLAHVHLDGGTGLLSGGGTLKEARLRFEKDYIGAVLEQHAGAITGAARTLGIQRTNLHRKIRALKIGR